MPRRALLLLALVACERQPAGMSRDQFSRELGARLSHDFCASDSTYFRSCFQVDEIECRQRVDEALGTCNDEFLESLPERLVGTEAAREAASILGHCAGQIYGSELAAVGRLSGAARCREKEAWAPSTP